MTPLAVQEAAPASASGALDPAAAERVGDSALPAEAVDSSPAASPEPFANCEVDPRSVNLALARAARGTGAPYEAWQPKKLNGRHLVMIEYHLAGHTNKEIAKVLECHEIDVGLILRSDLAKEYIGSRMDDLNREFQGLFRKVINVIDLSLSHPDLEIAQKAADKWLRAHGRYAPKKDDSAAVTAEDVIAKLLDQRAGPVTVNIDNRRQTYSYRDEPDARA